MTMKFLTNKEQIDELISKINASITKQSAITAQAKEDYDFAAAAVFWSSSSLLKRKDFYEHSSDILAHLNDHRNYLNEVKRGLIDAE